MPAQASTGGSRNTSSSDVNIASSNATVNAFLGSRQPSWMVGTAAAKSSSRHHPPRQPPAQGIAKQPAQTVLPSPAPSDEPSPRVSNHLDSPNPHPASLAEMHNTSFSGTSGPPGIPTTDARFVYDLSTFVPNVQEPLRAGFDGPLSAPSSNLQPPSIMSPPFPAHGHTGAVLASPQVSTGLSAPSPITDANYPTIATPHAQSNQSQAPPATGQNGTNQLKRRRTEPQPATKLRYASYMADIEQHIKNSGGEKSLSTEIERPRIQLLKEACKVEDGFFLALHQLYCLWTLSPAQVYPYFQQSPPQTIHAAFAIIETVLKKNQLIGPIHSKWFARFPAEITTLLNPPTVYGNFVAQVDAFLDKLAQHFETLARLSVERKYPYLVDELLFYLGCYSPVLQKIFFTASRRRLSVPDGQLGLHAELMFQQDQKEHVDKTTGRQVLTPITSAGEIERRNSRLIDFYKRLVPLSASHSSRATAAAAPPAPYSSHHPASLQRPGSSNHAPGPQPGVSNHREAALYSPTTSFAATFPPHISSGQSQPQVHSPVMAAPSPTTHQGVNSPVPAHFILPSNVIHQQQVSYYPTQGPQQPLHEQQSVLYQQQMQQMQHIRHQQHVSQHQSSVQPQMYHPHQSPLLQAPQAHYQQPYPHNVLNSGPAPNMAQTGLMHMPTSQQNQPQLQSLQHGATRNFSVDNGISPGAVLTTRAAPQQSLQTTPHQRPNIARGAQDRLLPIRGFQISRQDMAYDSTEKKSMMMSLHQAHVRSPKRVVRNMEAERYYQAVKSFPVAPTFLVPKSYIQEFQFVVTEEEYALASGASTKDGELLPTAEHFNGSLRWRVRCCKIPVLNKPLTEEYWCTLDMNWPSTIFMKFNGRPLTVRRQAHNGKDLATELTDMVVCGTNTLEVALPELKGQKSSARFVAVEVLETLSHSNLVSMVWEKGLVPEAQTLEIIKKRLTGSDQDDGISFGDSTISIDLADPFTRVMFKIPARGSACTHLECFDLETWLTTRPSKAPAACKHQYVKCECKPSPEPSNPDKWRCPVSGCPQDARPYSLRIDGFLLNVRAQLERENKLHARSMHVNADGQWSIVVDADDDSDDTEDDFGPPSKKRSLPPAAAAKRPDKEIEVIELLDDD